MVLRIMQGSMLFMRFWSLGNQMSHHNDWLMMLNAGRQLTMIFVMIYHPGHYSSYWLLNLWLHDFKNKRAPRSRLALNHFFCWIWLGLQSSALAWILADNCSTNACFFLALAVQHSVCEPPVQVTIIMWHRGLNHHLSIEGRCSKPGNHTARPCRLLPHGLRPEAMHGWVNLRFSLKHRASHIYFLQVLEFQPGQVLDCQDSEKTRHPYRYTFYKGKEKCKNTCGTPGLSPPKAKQNM